MRIDLKFITPSSIEELEAHWEELAFLHHFVPYKFEEQELKGFLEWCVPHVTLGYANGILIGCFCFEVYTRSVVLHGIFRPDLNKVVPLANRVKVHIHKLILNDVFEVMGKEKLIVKAEPTNRGVIGYTRMFGFEKLSNMDKGRCVWKLTRDRYRELIKG